MKSSTVLIACVVALVALTTTVVSADQPPQGSSKAVKLRPGDLIAAPSGNLGDKCTVVEAAGQGKGKGDKKKNGGKGKNDKKMQGDKKKKQLGPDADTTMKLRNVQMARIGAFVKTASGKLGAVVSDHIRNTNKAVLCSMKKGEQGTWSVTPGSYHGKEPAAGKKKVPLSVFDISEKFGSEHLAFNPIRLNVQFAGIGEPGTDEKVKFFTLKTESDGAVQLGKIVQVDDESFILQVAPADGGAPEQNAASKAESGSSSSSGESGSSSEGGSSTDTDDINPPISPVDRSAPVLTEDNKLVGFIGLAAQKLKAGQVFVWRADVAFKQFAKANNAVKLCSGDKQCVPVDKAVQPDGGESESSASSSGSGSSASGSSESSSTSGGASGEASGEASRAEESSKSKSNEESSEESSGEESSEESSEASGSGSGSGSSSGSSSGKQKSGAGAQDKSKTGKNKKKKKNGKKKLLRFL